nr:N-acetylmuramoyl-L-alanine amidase [Mangrovivirga halotolerans]
MRFSKNNSTIVKNNILLFSICFILFFGSFIPLDRAENKIDVIVIDAGHGGKDPGTHGQISKEKKVALEIALKLGATIEEYLEGVRVIYTRNNDSFLELYQRAELANRNNADLFVSIHCNWVGNPRVHGTETYVMGLHKSESNMQVAKRENEAILFEDNYQENYEGFDPNSPESAILFSLYQDAYLENSLKLAERIETQFSKRAGRRSRGVKQAGFAVLWRTSMPSVLVETGYLSNQKEEKELNKELIQEYIASGIFRAVRDYKEEIESRN